MSKLHRGYVKTSTGCFLIQIPDAESQWGFCLTDGEAIQ